MRVCILFVLIHVILCNVGNKYFMQEELDVAPPKTDYLTQLLDHTSPTSKQTWQQRYLIYDEYFDPNDGAVILYLCGEWTCDGAAGFAFKAAKQFNAIVFALEHRFYGDSQPFAGPDALKTEYMERYLSVSQALDDIAYFILSIKRNKLWGVQSNMPWIHMGGSYPGGLSAWFRYKYPHLTVGGLASSGVVNPILDFGMFDQQIYDSALLSGDDCVLSIKGAVALAQQLISDEQTRLSFLTTFDSQLLNDGEFFFYLVDTIVMQIQYGTRVEFCDSLQGLNEEQTLEVIRILSKKYSVEDYGSIYLSNVTYDRNRNSRQWYFQTCQEMGWMQTPSLINPMRPQALNLNFWKQWCQDSYGLSISFKPFWPDVSKTNTYYGGTNLNVKNLIMTNGYEDPWKQASVFQQQNNDITVIQIIAPNVAHCKDTKADNVSDPQEVIDARKNILNSFDQWIKDYRAQIQIDI